MKQIERRSSQGRFSRYLPPLCVLLPKLVGGGVRFAFAGFALAPWSCAIETVVGVLRREAVAVDTAIRKGVLILVHG